MVEQSAPWRGETSGVWRDGAIGLGQKITFDGPESIKWTQPLVHEDLVVTADARIDNRGELIAALDLGKRPAKDIPDDLLIACSYQKWGKSCPIRLIGEYSFAIWDKTARELFCARDAMGVKPFYYYLAEGAIIFGSTIRSLLSVPFVPRELSEIRMVNHLVYNADDKESTFYKDIFRLPGGHCLSVSSAGSRKWQFWDLDADRELDLRSDDEYAGAFRELFTEAVNCRLRGAKPVGTFLSGGMDSSSLTCVARDLLKKSDRGPLHSFSSVFPKMAEKDRRIDESHYQKLVVDAGGIVHHPVITDAINPLHEHLWDGDEPSSLFNTYLLQTILAQARKSDVQVMLDGIDGDSTISHGTRYITELARRGRWFKMLNESRALAKNLHFSLFKVLWVMGLNPWVPDFVKTVVGVVRRRPRQNFSRLNLLSPDLVARSHAHEEMEKYHELRQVKAWSFRIEHKFSIMQGLWAQSLDL
jgi:asparagine synthase (glutamine-hydrolysing)